MNGQGGNFDYSYPKDSTDETRGWKVVGRFFLMVGLLIGIVAYTKIIDLSILACIIGVIILTWRFLIEWGKSSEDLSAIKEIGRAKFCGEKIPNVSSNYASFKRTNQVLMWLLILAFGSWCFGKQLMLF